jgi:Holliday junction resolvase
MTQAESRVSKSIIDALRGKKVFAWKVHGSPLTPAGLPDIIACVEGYFLGFETKMPGKRSNVSEVQKLRHEEIRAAGGEVFVVCGPKEAVAKLDEWLTRKRIPTN